MSLISNWLWGTSQLDEAIDKATSELLPAGSEDIALNLEICDQIRSKSVPAKDAMRALKRRLNHKNPNVQLLTLGLTDICVKNGGDHFLTEIASREFIDNLISILRMDSLNLDVKNTTLRFLQNWSVAFEGKPSLGYVSQACRNLQNEGFKFPPKDLTAASSAMVDTQTAPEWIDSDVCLRCRTPFSFTNRKHHCRNCGQVFDQACSSKTMTLPHFGITQEVRVCDTCYNKMAKRADKNDKGHRHSASMHSGRHSRARDLADAELQRAIQLSLQQVGAAGGHSRPGYVPYQPTYRYSEPPIVDRTTHPASPSEEEDPDLKAAIEASLREANAPKPSAPIVVETPRSEQPSYDGPGYSQSYPPGVVPPHPALPTIPNYDLEPLETDAILTFSQTVEQVQAQGGRDMSRYPAVNELYDKANSLRPKLAMSVDDTGRKEQMLSEMHEQLSQAVRLYDQLLSQQVAHPRWRPQENSPSMYQNPGVSYAPPANGYAHWGPPNGYQAQPQPQPSYFPTQEVHNSTQQPQMQYHTQQPTSPHMQLSQAASSPSTSYPQSSYQASSPTPVPHASHTSLQHYTSPTPVQHYSNPSQQQYTASAPSVQPSSQFTPTSSTPVPQVPQTPLSQQYTSPTPVQQYSTLPPEQHTASAPPIQSSSQFTPALPTPTSPSQYSSAIPAQQYSTLPQQQYATPTPAPPTQSSSQFTPTSSSLSRQNTVSYAPPATPQPSASSLARSHTVTYAARTHPQQTYTQPYTPSRQSAPTEPSQYQHQYQNSSAPTATSGVTSLPQFPVAPTSAPQTFSLYGSTPSLPTGIAQTEERHEALLIDL
ncbi:hypothetical protein DFJ43DRAFT_1059236 [Lentinula guzmanii]|uniref:Vacuolar protein sorting-associated protein 27 n=1 Tax=Lentinula guzmanii TaxID=2804957 RepID=A0AA38JE23_9AGAR|nr:hypothetical protein DFJ43DRAFT_1059236 [Lentinula guzmanii]